MFRVVSVFLTVVFVSLANAQLITDVQVEDNKRVDSSLILSVCPLKKGDYLTPDGLSSSIRALYALGLFKDIAIDTQTVNGNFLVRVAVDENPVLDELSFTGNRRVNEKELREKLGIREGDIISQFKVFTSVQKLKELYADKGFLLTEVTPELDEEDGRAILLFRVTEGEKQKIREIRVENTGAFPGSRLEKLMKNREKT